MMGYTLGSEITNKFGNVESILFVTNNGVMLSGDGEKVGEHYVSRSDFDESLDAQTYLLRQKQHPHIVLTDYQKSTITERLMYLTVLKTLVSEGYPATTAQTYNELIKRVEREHPATIATQHPKWKTICRHWRNWVQADFNDEALAGQKRNCAARLNAATEAFLQHHVATVYTCNNSNFKQAFYSHYKREAEKAQLENSEIKIASNRTYYRRLGEITDAEKLANFKGLSEAEINKRLTTLRKKIKTYYAMQRVECDRVVLNMCLIDDKTGLPTPTISLYVAIDVYTRAPIAVVLSLEPENSSGGLNLLRQIFMSDKNLTMNGRKPNVLIMDNGPGFNNSLVKKAAQRLGVELHYTPSNQPAKKPFIESFFNFIRNKFFSGMTIETQNGESSIGFQSYSRKRTSPKSIDTIPLPKRADITISNFRKLLNVFLTEYMHKHHKSAGHIPIEKWEQSIIDTPAPSFTYGQLQHCFHVSQDKPSHKLQSRGTVRYLRQDFFSDELKAFFNATKKDMDLGENPSVNVFGDRHDARKVSVVVTLPGKEEPVEIIAHNTALDETSLPVSFDELNDDATPTQYGIYQGHYHHKPTGHYVGQIDSFFKQKASRKRRRGPTAPSFNENTENNLTVEARIKESHKLTITKSSQSQMSGQDECEQSMISQTKTMTPTRSDDEGNTKQW